MNIIGDFVYQSEIVDGFDAPELYNALFLEHVEVGGVHYIYVSSYGDDGLQVLQLGANGQITAVQSVAYSASNLLDEPNELVSVSFGGESYIITANWDVDALSVFRIDNDNVGTNGHLNLTDTHTLSDGGGNTQFMDGLNAVAVVELDNRAIVIAGGFYGDGIGSFELDTNGELTLLDSVHNSDATAYELDGVQDLDVLEIDGRTFVFATADYDQGVGVFELDTSTGALTSVFQEHFGRSVFVGDVVEYNGENLLFTAGSNYVQVSRINADGTLTFLREQYAGDIGAYYPHSFETVEIDGVSFILVTDGSDYGTVSMFALDDTYGLVGIQEISGNTFDGATDAIPVEINGNLYVVSTARDDSRVVVTKVGDQDEYLIGTDGADKIVGLGGEDDLLGRAGHDEIKGGDQDDVLSGNNGSDTLDGGNGEDVLVGGNGNDVLIGGAGADIMKGSSGSDWLSYENSNVGVRVNLETGAAKFGDAEGDLFRDMENLRGSQSADTLTGDAYDNKINGESGHDDIFAGDGHDTVAGDAGHDAIEGGKGNDELNGGNGNDSILGQNGDDTLLGGKGADTLAGGNGADQIQGGGGNDLIVGGGADDILSGQGGRDTFEFVGDFGNDIVSDFKAGSKGDFLDFSAVDDINSLSDFYARAFTIAGDTIITFEDPALSVIIENVTEAALIEANFIF